MMKKAFVKCLAALLCLALLCGCSDPVIDPAPSASGTSGKSAGAASAASSASAAPAKADITLKGDTAKIKGSGASVSGGTVTVSSPGEYTLSGTLEGCVVVNTGEVKGDVTLRLCGAEIHCADGAALRVEQVKNCHVVLVDGTQNRLVSGAEGVLPAEKLDGAALFSEDDLDISGGGSLELLGYLNNGLTCKDDLEISGGEIRVWAVNNGVQGAESVEISGGSLDVTAGNDGVKSSSSRKEGKGYVRIGDAALTVSAGGDGVAAETELEITGGTLKITTSGASDGASSKGLKARKLLSISGGEITVDSADHALHSAGNLMITDGAFTLRSRAGKGVSANGAMELRGGRFDIDAAGDGIRAELAVTIYGGEYSILAGADGIKAGSKSSVNGTLEILDGSIDVNAFAGPIDARGGATISGGVFVGVGSPKNPMGFAASGAQRSLLFRFAGGKDQTAEIRTASGELVAAITARCGFTCAIYSAPELAPGSYTLSRGTISASAEA